MPLSKAEGQAIVQDMIRSFDWRPGRYSTQSMQDHFVAKLTEAGLIEGEDDELPTASPDYLIANPEAVGNPDIDPILVPIPPIVVPASETDGKMMTIQYGDTDLVVSMPEHPDNIPEGWSVVTDPDADTGGGPSGDADPTDSGGGTSTPSSSDSSSVPSSSESSESESESESSSESESRPSAGLDEDPEATT